VQMMRSFNEKFKILNLDFAGLEATSCEFPYSDNTYAMTVIMPKDLIDLQVIESSLSADTLYKIINHKAPLSNAIIFLPKFKISTHFDVNIYYILLLNLDELFIFKKSYRITLKTWAFHHYSIEKKRI